MEDISQIYLPALLSTDTDVIKVSNILIQMQGQDMNPVDRHVRGFLFKVAHDKTRQFIEEYGVEQWQIVPSERVCEYVVDFTPFLEDPEVKKIMSKAGQEEQIAASLDKIYEKRLLIYVNGEAGKDQPPIKLPIFGKQQDAPYGDKRFKITFTKEFLQLFITELYDTTKDLLNGTHYMMVGQAVKGKKEKDEILYKYLTGIIQTEAFFNSSDFSFRVDAEYLINLMDAEAMATYKTVPSCRKKVFDGSVSRILKNTPLSFDANFYKDANNKRYYIVFSNFSFNGVTINRELLDNANEEKRAMREQDEMKKKEFILFSSSEGFTPAQTIELMGKAAPNYMENFNKVKNMFEVYLTLGEVTEEQKYDFFSKTLYEIEKR